MHIPDNYLSPTTCAAVGAVMIPIWRRASTNIKKEITRQKMPLLGICTAFSFLIMMFNIPLPGGTTGHAVGAALVAILLGPYSAVISVSVALVIQALFFGDGGILALGVNCFNMAFVMPFTAFYIFKLIKNRFSSEKGEYAAAFIAGYISLNIAAFITAVEFGIQPMFFKDALGLPLYSPYGLNVSIPAMVIPHLLIVGVLEGFVTAGVYSYVKKVSPEIIYKGTIKRLRPLYRFIIALILISPLGLLATGTAWGEWSAEEINKFVGFIPKGMERGFNFIAPMGDYTLKGVFEPVAYIFSALVGVILIFLIFSFLGKLDLKKDIEKVNK